MLRRSWRVDFISPCGASAPLFAGYRGSEANLKPRAGVSLHELPGGHCVLVNWTPAGGVPVPKVPVDSRGIFSQLSGLATGLPRVPEL